MSRRALTAALALSFVLAGCGVAGETTSGSGAAKTSAADAAAPALPKGYVWQTIDEVSLKFAVPAGWSAINPKKLIASGDTSVFDEMAEKMGVTPQQMQQAVGTADLVLLAAPKEGYADNVTGLVVPLAGLPTEAQLKSQMGQASDEEVTVTTAESPAGPTITASYVLTVGTKAVQGRSLFVEGEDGVLNLAVSALDADLSTEVTDVIRSTIHKV